MSMQTISLLLLATVTAVFGQGTPVTDYFDVNANNFNGIASNYGGPADGGDGAAIFGLSVGGCGYGNIASASKYPRRSALAFDPNSPAIAGLPSYGCGTCWKVTNPGNQYKAYVAMVTDICPKCNEQRSTDYAVDVDYKTWLQAAEPNNYGTYNVILEQVNCRPTGNVQLVITDFTGPWNWIRLYPYQVGGIGAVSSVELNCPFTNMGGGYVKLQNTFGAVWEAKDPKVPNYKDQGLCTFIITSAAGQKIYKDVELEDYKYKGGVVDTGAQFDGSYRAGAGDAWRFGRKLMGDEHATSEHVHLHQPVAGAKKFEAFVNHDTGIIHAAREVRK